MENIYCLSGLGADQRIFKHLRIKGAKLIYIPWVPFDRHDDLAAYATKMFAQIPEKKPTIIGISFGGMLATEIANTQLVKQVFLISSAKGKHELPEINSALKWLVQHNLIPYNLFKHPNKILFEMFGAKTDEEKELVSDLTKDTDVSFLSWAFEAILNWRNTTVPEHIIHIHGTEDRILRPEYIDATYWLNHGTHMMVYNRAEEISGLISSYINK